MYDVVDCKYNFAEGSELKSDSDGKNHFTSWNEERTYFIKCRDDYGNMPLPNQCSMTVRPFKVSEGN